MIKTILFLHIFIPCLLLAQKTVKVTERHNRWDKEIYYVLKSDRSVRQGKCQRIGFNGQVDAEGNYKNGLKDSTWTEFMGKGTYANGVKVGIWKYYYSEEFLEQEYDYTKNEFNELIIQCKIKNKEYSVIKDEDTIISVLDRPPILLGGGSSIRSTMADFDFKIPKQARKRKISGIVEITFTIDSTGATSNHRISKEFGYGYDEEALMFVKSLPETWLPGQLNGQAVTVEYVMCVSFLLDRKERAATINVF
jgi:periplasmic protein TonB